jgi:hypothetical protein
MTFMAYARIALCLLASGWISASWAQALSDPTRPPPGWGDPLAKVGAPSGSTATAAEAGAPKELQVLLVRGTRKFAVIDHQLVELGGAIDDGRLVEVNASGVILKSAQGLETLKLYPGVEKVMSGQPGKVLKGIAR